MGRWLSSVFRSMVGGALLLFLITVGVPFLAWLQSLAWYVIALSAIGAFGLTLFTINQLHLLRLRRKTKNIEDFVASLLIKLGVALRKDKNDKAKFQFTITHSNEHIVIAQLLDNLDLLTFGIKLNVIEGDRELLDKVTARQESTVIEDLKIEMARFGVMYQGIIHPLRSITIMTAVPSVGLSEASLLGGIEFIRRARILLQSLIRKEVRISGMETSN